MMGSKTLIRDQPTLNLVRVPNQTESPKCQAKQGGTSLKIGLIFWGIR